MQKYLLDSVQAVHKSNINNFQRALTVLSQILDPSKGQLNITYTQSNSGEAIPLFHYLIRSEFVEAITWMLSDEFQSECPNIRIPEIGSIENDQRGLPPIAYALILGNITITQLLLQHGARVDFILPGGDTIYHTLVRFNHSPDGLQWLLAKSWADRFSNLSVPDINCINSEQYSAA